MKYSKIIEPPETNKIKSGRMILNPEESVGRHNTDKKEEVIIVLKGTATVFLDDKVIDVGSGELLYIPKNTEHDVKNKGSEPLEYIYVVCMLEKK
jgi:mannose-1-phosphate guanylyltransferase/mannose-6-phosphate isomerase